MSYTQSLQELHQAMLEEKEDNWYLWNCDNECKDGVCEMKNFADFDKMFEDEDGDEVF